jgi:hypothetical protein
MCASKIKLSRFREFFLFEVVRVNEFQHRIPKQVRILAVVEPPLHLVNKSNAARYRH